MKFFQVCVLVSAILVGALAAEVQTADDEFTLPMFSAPECYGNFADVDFHEFVEDDSVSIVLSIEGRAGGAQIRLVGEDQTREKSCDTCIDINIGANDNTAIDITYMGLRENSQHIAPLFNGRVLDKEDYRWFWINYAHGETSVGFGKHVYRNMVVSHRSDALQQYFNWTTAQQGKQVLKGLRYVAFAADEDWVHYNNVKIARGFVPRWTANAPVVSNPGAGLTYVQFHFPRMFEVSSKHFEVEFEAQGMNDLMIGFLRTFRMRSADDHAYEVILEEAYERNEHKSRCSIQFGTGRGSVDLAVLERTGVLHSAEFRPFWIRLKDGILSVGTGREMGENILMQTLSQVPDSGTDSLWLSSAAYHFANSIRILAVRSKFGNFDIDYEAYDHPVVEDKAPCDPITLFTDNGASYLPYIASPICHDEDLCTSPEYHYSMEVTTVPARNQWWHHGAFCGEMSVQSIAMSYGVYLSQKKIRMYASQNQNPIYFFNPGEGYELSDENMMPTLMKLGFEAEAWDSYNQPTPQIYTYLRWIKHHLVRGHPVVWASRYFEPKFYDHMEPVWGIQSKHPLSDPTVYPDDVFAYNFGVGLKRLYRRVDSLFDKNDVPTGFDKNKGNNCTMTTMECLFYDQNWGYAIKGLMDPKKKSIPTSVDVSDNGFEPTPPFVIPTRARVTVHGPLNIGSRYRIFRWDDVFAFPHDSNYENSAYSYVHEFVAKDDTYHYSDPNEFPSDSTVYYVTVKASLHPLTTRKRMLSTAAQKLLTKTKSTDEHTIYESADPTREVHYLGCFKDNVVQRAVPHFRGKLFVDRSILLTHSPEPMKQCQAFAQEAGDNIFAIQNGDQCWTGKDVHFDMHGPQNKRFLCTALGGLLTSQVYLVDMKF